MLGPFKGRQYNPVSCGWRNNREVLNAFVDDSGSGGDSPWYVLSGVVSTVEKWAEFSVEWEGVCKSEPRIDYFKMSEASAQSGQFAKFSKEERESKLEALATLIDRHVLFSKNVMVEQEPFDRILKPLLPKTLATPYLFACGGMIVAVSSHEEYAGRSEKIQCIFDAQQKIGNRAARLYEQIVGIKSKLGKPLPGFESSDLVILPNLFRDEKQFLPIQAADMVAWHVRRFWCRNYRSPYHNKLMPTSLRSQTLWLREARLRLMAEQFDPALIKKWAELTQRKLKEMD